MQKLCKREVKLLFLDRTGFFFFFWKGVFFFLFFHGRFEAAHQISLEYSVSPKQYYVIPKKEFVHDELV